MNFKFKILTASIALIMCSVFGTETYSQTEGFNVKTPIEKIADSSTDLLKEVMTISKEEPKKAIPQSLVCSSSCFLVIPNIEIVQGRGDFTGTGLLACRNPSADKFTEPIYYDINNLTSFEEGGGGVVILVSNTDGMKSILGNYVHLDTDNNSVGTLGKASKNDKTFISYAKYKDQGLSGINLSGSVLDYSSKDTFDAYQGTVVPIEILINPQDVPPVLRDFDSLLAEWSKGCK